MATRRPPLRAGDLCHHGSSSYPVYTVICVNHGRAWLRDISSGVEAIVDVDRCTRLEPEEVRELEAGGPPPARRPPGAEAPEPDAGPSPGLKTAEFEGHPARGRRGRYLADS